MTIAQAERTTLCGQGITGQRVAGQGFARKAFAPIAFDRERWSRLADGLAVALAVSLPWSTSATSILAALWLIVLLPTLDPAALRRVLGTPAGSLPALLWALGVLGMFWAEVSWAERVRGLEPFHKLLCIPLLMAQFSRPDRGAHRPGLWLTAAYLGSCIVLLVVSFALLALPALAWWPLAMPGIPVKNYAAQSELFTICVFLLAEVARRWWKRRRAWALAAAALSLAFLANILFVATTRTALVAIPVVLLVYGWRQWGRRGLVAGLCGAGVLGALALQLSPHLQTRVATFMTEVQAYSASNERNSAGERLEFWHKSVGFIARAPMIGHGTGSIRDQFDKAVVGEIGASAVASTNPHNQTLAVAIQLGVIGSAVLFAMWLAHLMQFRVTVLFASVGFVVVVQNMVGSLFNSQLFDFTHGWGYVIGVGVAAGMTLRHDGNEPCLPVHGRNGREF